MGAYAMPSNRGFKTNKELKRTHKKSNLDRCAALLRENDMYIDKENNRIILVKKENGDNKNNG